MPGVSVGVRPSTRLSASRDRWQWQSGDGRGIEAAWLLLSSLALPAAPRRGWDKNPRQLLGSEQGKGNKDSVMEELQGPMFIITRWDRVNVALIREQRVTLLDKTRGDCHCCKVTKCIEDKGFTSKYNIRKCDRKKAELKAVNVFATVTN